MDIKELLERAAKAKARQTKNSDKDTLADLMRQVEQRERDRLQALGAVQAAEQAERYAQGELEAAEFNLKRAMAALEEAI